MIYYTRLRSLWDEMDAIRPTQVCICGHGSDTLNNMNQDRAMGFSQGLHDRFASLRSSILQREVFPPIFTIYNFIHQEPSTMFFWLCLVLHFFFFICAPRV